MATRCGFCVPMILPEECHALWHEYSLHLVAVQQSQHTGFGLCSLKLPSLLAFSLHAWTVRTL